MKIYISGKITGLPYGQAWRKFADAERVLRDQGLDPVNPMRLFKPEEQLSWEQYMIKDIEVLMGCDAIYMLHDWRESRGARIEHTIASEIGIRIVSSNTVESVVAPLVIDISVAEYYQLSVDDMKKITRKKTIREPRQVAMYLQKKHTKQSLAAIGSRFGKDHATVLNAVKRINNYLDTEGEFREKIADIETLIKRKTLNLL